MDERSLKNELTYLKMNNFSFDQAYDVHELSDRMFQSIGVVDSELRDKLIYHGYYYLITNEYLSETYLEALLCKCMDKLFTGIGLTEDDTVFTRSFTSLVIALILLADNKKPFLSKKTVLKVKDALCTYTQQENDVRGYVEGKGWAHSIAHVADAFDELAKNRYIDEKVCEELVDVLVSKICSASEVYMNEEEERIVVAIGTILERGVDETLLIEVIRKRYTWESTITMNECNRKYMNRKNFLRSLHAYAKPEKNTQLAKEVHVLLEVVRDMYYKH
jgi:Protein of unknown function (DUF2785)